VWGGGWGGCDRGKGCKQRNHRQISRNLLKKLSNGHSQANLSNSSTRQKFASLSNSSTRQNGHFRHFGRTRYIRPPFANYFPRTRYIRPTFANHFPRTRYIRSHSPKAIFEKNVTRLDTFARVIRHFGKFGASGHCLKKCNKTRIMGPPCQFFPEILDPLPGILAKT
jgi:hypothetical protein